jgi:hypothetical protein
MVSLLALLTVIAVCALFLAADSRSRFINLPTTDRLFVLASPLPIVLTLIVPLAINILTNFRASEALHLITIYGCVASVGLTLIGIVLSGKKSTVPSRRYVVMVATLLAAIPALMLLLFYLLWGMIGALR